MLWQTILLAGGILAQNKINEPVNYPALIQNKTDTTFVIGGLFSLTQDGTDSTVLSKGIQRFEAFKCAVAALNNNNTVNGVTFEYNVQDDLGVGSTGLYKTLSFIQDGVMAVVGAGPSGVTDPVARLISTFNTPLISYASSAVPLSNLDIYSTLMRTVASDEAQTKGMIAAAKQFGWSLIAAAGTLDTYGSSGLSGFVNKAALNDVSVTCNRIISNPDSLSEVTTFGTCIKESTAKVVMLFSKF